MSCNNCGSENPDTAKFCTKCGVSLKNVCPSCSHENLLEAKFCAECGDLLSESGKEGNNKESQLIDVQRQSPDAERRQITVMFCDLVESTALFEEYDPEDIRQIIREYQEECAKLIQKYDGHIAKYLGDGILIYFGYPTAHEDDAERAVRTGLEIIERIKTFSARLQKSTNIRLEVRIGISTGLVVAGEMGGGEKREPMAIVGDSPNIASRLQSLAKPNNLLISSYTYKLVEGYFECIDLGKHNLKGVSTPVAIYHVLRKTAISGHIDVAVNRGLTPLVGRENELGLLIERWERVKRGEGQVVLICGEAGIGKSRLVHMLKEHVKEGPHIRIESRCSPFYQNSALYPVIDNLENLLWRMSEDSAEERITVLERILKQRGFSLPDVIPLLAPILSIDMPARYEYPALSPQMKKQRTLTALTSWLIKESEGQPVIRIIEDVHWVDPTTLEFLSLVLDQVATAPILIVLTYRPDFTPEWSMRSNITQITLNRLTDKQVNSLAESLAMGKALPAEVLRHLVAKTDGVPLYVEELTKMILESELLEESEDCFLLKGPLPDHVIPTTLQDSLMARLDRLNTNKDVLQIGATLGREFTYDLLNKVLPLDEETLEKELTKLVKAELLYQRGYPPESKYIFKHALIQDAAYQSMLKSKREHYHKKIGQILEDDFPETLENQPELIANHYTYSGQKDRALQYWHRAGKRAIEKSAHSEAVNHLKKGIDLISSLPQTSDRDQEELALLILLGVALRVTKGFASRDVHKVYSRAHDLSKRASDVPELFPILRGLCGYYIARGEFILAHELAEQCLHLAENLKNSENLLQAHYLLGATLFCTGEFSLSHEQSVKGFALYSPEYHSTNILHSGIDQGLGCLFWSAWSLWFLGYPDQAIMKGKEALALAKELSHIHSLAIAHDLLAFLHQLRGEPKDAHGNTEKAIKLSNELGSEFFLEMGYMINGWVLFEQGKKDEGISLMEKALEEWVNTGAEMFCSYWLSLLADAYMKMDEFQKGLTLIETALDTAIRNEETFYRAELYRLMGDSLLIRDQTEAENCYRNAIELASEQNAKSLELRAAISLSKMLLKQKKTMRH